MALDPKMKEAYDKVVIAGLKALYSPQTRKVLLQGLAGEAPPWQIAATEIAGLLKMLDEKSGGKMPKQVMGPAGITLMLDLLKFMDESGKAEVAEEDVTQGMKALQEILVGEYNSANNSPAPQGAPAQPAPAAPAPGAPQGMIAGGR